MQAYLAEKLAEMARADEQVDNADERHKIRSLAYSLTGLADLLLENTEYVLGVKDLDGLINLEWSYECLAAVAQQIADKLSDLEA